jgi:hypothetical protein
LRCSNFCEIARHEELRIAGWIYLAGVILVALILVAFHNKMLGTDHLGLQHSRLPFSGLCCCGARIRYERTLRKLSLVDRNDPITEIIAKKIIELEQRGVREQGSPLRAGSTIRS